MDKLKDALVDLIEPDFGLLDALLANELLCNRKYAEVRSMPTVYKRNERLLRFMRAHKRQDKLDRFNEALELASQLHVVNFIRKNGIRSEDSDDFCWPLSPKERQILNRNRFHLVKMIEPDNGLVTGLFSHDVINQRQSEFILSCPPRSEKVEALLEILLRRSTRDLSVTVECLREVCQNHVADILCRDGVMFPIHIKNTEQFETAIISQVRDIISGRSPDEQLKMVELLKLRDEDIYVVFVERSASIIMYFYCVSINGLERLHELWTSGCLTQHVETTFRRMTSPDVDMKLELEFNVVEYERLRKQLREDEVDLVSAGSGEPIAMPEVAGHFEASSGFEADDSPVSLEVTEGEFLHMFWDLDTRISSSGEELHQAVDVHVQSLKDEVSSLRENFLELVRRRSEWLPNPLEEQKDVRKDRFRGATVAGRSLSTGCASRSEVEDHHSKSIWSSAEYATEVNDAEKKLSPRRYQLTETEEVPDVCECEKLDDLDTKKQIPFGIAYFLEKFYIVCLESNTILAYNSSSPFTLEEELTVEGLISPHDIAASHSSLYVTDASRNRIWKIDTKHRSFCWMEEVGAPHTISVTPNQEVLVCSEKPPTIKFFASDATLRLSVSLPSRITKPTHAVATAEGHVIVSHGGVQSSEQEICALSADGKFVRVFPSKLAWPCHLAIDHVKGLVFVADFWSKRILILNARFNPVAEISRKHDSPWRLCYAPDLQKLLVGASHTVEVYDVLCKA